MGYVVSVMPPRHEAGGRFDIGESDYDEACVTARRYRERGWGATVIGPMDEWHEWLVSGSGIITRHVPARTSDEARMIARCDDGGYTTAQRRD